MNLQNVKIALWIIGIATLVWLVSNGIPGCSNKRKEIDPQKVKWINQMTKNAIQEHFSLLSAKYGIEDQRLIDIIVDYERMTTGRSDTKGLMDLKADTKISFGDILDVPTALKKLSEKYRITSKELASIIIEKELLDCLSK